MKLISIFPILPTESGRGYYRRLASNNMLASWRELARECGVSVSKTGLFCRPDFVADSLDLDRLWCREASLRDDIARGWRGLRRSRLEAVCPHCLAESPHLRLSWEHAYMIACPHHEVQLCSVCSACGEGLSSSRERIEFCSCGHDLRSEETARATPAQLWLASLIDSDGATSRQWLPAVEGAPLDLVMMLARTLCLFHDPSAVPAKQNSAPPKTLLEAAHFLRPLDELLADWPRTFEAHVSARIAAGTPEARTLNTLLGKWYLQLQALSDCAPLKPFLDAVGRVAGVEFDGVLGLDRAAESITKESTHVRLAHAAKRMGMHRDTLAKYLKRSQLTFRTKRFGTKGVVYEVPVAEVEAVLKARAAWCSDGEAAAALGVPASTIEHLKVETLIQHEPEWRQNVRKGGPVELASVHHFISRLRALPTACRREGEKLIALRELSVRRAGDGKAVRSALRAICEGKILPVGPAPTVGELQFHLCELAQYFARPVFDAGLSIEALAKLTGWKWESINHWIQLGLMQSNSIVLRGQSCRVVMPDQLLAFCRAYVPLSDVARALGTKSSALSERLGGVEVVGSLILPSGHRRGGLIRVGDLARAALEKEGGASGRGRHGAAAEALLNVHAFSIDSTTA